MEPGKINKRMTIYEPMDVADGQGGRAREWMAKYNVWGSLKVPKASVKEIQGNMTSELTYEVVLRRLPAGSSVVGWRLKCDGLLYDIVADYPGYEFVTVLQVRRHQGRA